MGKTKKERKEEQAVRNENKLFTCRVCKPEGRTYTSSTLLMTHGEKAHKGKFVRCVRCEILFSNSTDELETHNSEVHPRRNCPACGEVFDVEALEKHTEYCLEEEEEEEE